MHSPIIQLRHILQTAALQGSPREQVDLFVSSIGAALAVDVCDLFLLNTKHEMQLVGSHGAAAGKMGKVKIPLGRGLIGLATSSRHPISFRDASQHPAYYPDSDPLDARLRGFCAVPLIAGAEIIGVLAVQARSARTFSEEDVAFLVTLGAQLALLLANQKASLTERPDQTLRLTGSCGAPGIGIGYVQVCASEDLFNIADAPCTDIDAALVEWRRIIKSACLEIDAELEELRAAQVASAEGIFAAYKLLLDDPLLSEHVEAGIQAGNWLPGSLRRTIQKFTDVFHDMSDQYIRARSEDLHHVGNKLLKIWRGVEQLVPRAGQPVVLVGTQVSVSDMAKIPGNQLVGIVCLAGSSLSHSAVLANAMGVPAVMGTGVIKNIHEGDDVIVDGTQGVVILSASATERAEYEKLIKRDTELTQELAKLCDQPAVTTDGTAVTLLTNTGLLADISPGLANGAQGVGLYRTEIPFMIADGFPTEEEQRLVYRQVLSAYKGSPVYMRTLDIGGDKQLPYFPIQNEDNPALGWRGIRFGLDNSLLLMTQVRAMVRAAEGLDNLSILLPMVSSSWEINSFKTLLDDACSQLRQEGVAVSVPKIGIMLEVPAATSQLSFWRDKIDFISIGSNDLSQYLLALDRNNARVSAHYDHVHPAVLHEIYRIVNKARSLKLPLSLCGEMASDPVAVVLLLGMGIRVLSMSATKLPRIKWLIRTLEIKRMQQLAMQALEASDSQQIRQEVKQGLQGLGLGALFK